MRIVAVSAQIARWSIEPGGAARGVDARIALVVEVRDDTGEIGLGEAAPLPGISPDSVADAELAIARLAERVPFVVDTTAEIAELVAAITRAPAAGFAIETALLAALAARAGVPLADLLAGHPCGELACAAVVDDPASARDAVARGFGCLKIKVGPELGLARIVAIANAAPAVRLRLDANRSWQPRDVAAHLVALGDLPIDYVEEPCRDAHRLVAEPLALPLALDESLGQLTPVELAVALRSGRLGALVLKPTLLGLTRTRELARAAATAGVPAIVSHALEGPIGTAACAELALAISGAPAGLGQHPALAGWAVAAPQLRRSSIRTAGAGLGLGRLGLATVLQPLSMRAAGGPADPPRELPAIIGRVTTSFTSCAGRLPAPMAGLRSIIATPSVDTLLAIYAALEARVPIALHHHRLAAEELARRHAVLAAAPLPPDAAVVLFTSGSTGRARGVVLSRAALIGAAQANAAHLGWRDDDRWLLALSLAHAGGLAIAIRCLAARKPVVLLEDDLGSEGIARLLHDARVTIASLVPTQLVALLDDPGWGPPAQLRAVLLGGAAATPELLERAEARRIRFLVTYGMTESFGQVATAPLDRAGDPRAPLIALPGVTLSAGTAAAPAAIRIRGAMLATHYVDGKLIAPEFVSSDLGHVDDHGALHVVGRADDVIITGGENVHPVEVEAVLAATPGVRAACVFAVPDARWGHIVAAAIAIEPGFDAAVAAARWHAALAPHARPRRLAITSGLPMLPTGKLDRRAAAALPATPLLYER